MMAALLRCRVLVSNDSGAAHLAAALGRATVVLFGPTDPRRSRPVGAHVRVLAARSFCQPCGYRACPIDHRCMSDLEPQAVLAAVTAAWQQGGSFSPAAEVVP
jgi:heptosyltransferase-2